MCLASLRRCLFRLSSRLFFVIYDLEVSDPSSLSSVVHHFLCCFVGSAVDVHVSSSQNLVSRSQFGKW